MIKHELLMLAIQARHPELTHCVDFICGHPIDAVTGLQSDNAFIYKWMSTIIPQPTDMAQLLVEAAAQLPVLQARNVRAERNRRLQSSDHTQGWDSPEANRTAWATYRQALRDLPNQSTFPHDPAWPVSP